MASKKKLRKKLRRLEADAQWYSDRLHFTDDTIGDAMAENDDMVSRHRIFERNRISAILRSPEAKGQRAAAECMALDTSLPRDEAIRLLRQKRDGEGYATS